MLYRLAKADFGGDASAVDDFFGWFGDVVRVEQVSGDVEAFADGVGIAMDVAVGASGKGFVCGPSLVA